MIEFLPSRQVALELLGFSVHWYGIMYLLAFLLAYVLIDRLQGRRSLQLEKEDISALLTWAVLGVILGGRLGYVFFYELSYFTQHPLEVLYVWNGGMSSHGGFIGVAVALAIALVKRGIPILRFLDIITVPIALGLALGRFGNFINLELYGVQTSVPWAIAIPGVEGLRHPTFFYAIAKNLFIALVCYWHLRSTRGVPGTVFALFLMLYGILRFVVENYRVQQYALTDLGFVTLTRGQILSIPIVVVSFCLMVWLYRR